MAQRKAATTPAPAITKPAPISNLKKFDGVIKNVDAMAKSIVVAKEKEKKTFAVHEDAKITKGKETLAFADLKEGMNVGIEYKMETGKLIALTIFLILL
jgi:hypothetical protein